MIDLHCHLLPGIDDGAVGLAHAVDMLHAYAEDGVETVVATPHLRGDFPAVIPAELAGRCEAVRMAAAIDGNDLRIVPGGEVSLTWALDASDDELRAVSLDGLGRDLLIETPPSPMAPGVDRALFAVALRGYRVTLAHPELSRSFQRAPQALAELVRRGVLLQITSSSLQRPTRSSGSATLAHGLVREGLCSAIASDAHSPGPWRPPELARGVLAAARTAGPARAEWLVTDAPAAILAGDPLPPLPSEAPTPRGRSWLRRRVGV